MARQVEFQLSLAGVEGGIDRIGEKGLPVKHPTIKLVIFLMHYAALLVLYSPYCPTAPTGPGLPLIEA